MNSITKDILFFLKEVAKNNNREWFLAHKALYEKAKTDFEEFIQSLLYSMIKIDSRFSTVNPKRRIYRIYRDVRFSKDKSPYKTNFGAYLNVYDRKSSDRAGYYVHIEPNKSFLGGGAYQPSSVWLKSIRKLVASTGSEFKDIISKKSFRKSFPSIYSDSLKIPPRGFDKNHPNIEFIKMRSFIATRDLKDHEILSDDFLKLASDSFKKAQPLVDFLDRATNVSP